VELDVLAYAPGDGTLWHIETSGDSESWEQRKQRFLQKKFVLSHREYEQAIGSKISSIKKLAVVGQTRTAKASLDWGGDIEVVLIPQFVQRVATVLRKRDPMSEAVPEGYPLLRSMQMALAYGMERT
jgi:predicted oxidoreductase